jgi:UDP-N-acetyl-D-glucosamine dehydrogenase
MNQLLDSSRDLKLPNAALEAIKNFLSLEARVGIIGLGYAGLPLACCFAESGFKTVGFDIDSTKIERLQRGRSYIASISSQRLSSLVTKQVLLPTADFEGLSACDAAIICVPTPLGEGRTPDLTHVVNTATEVSRRLRPGQLVVLESTTYPGTTDEVVLPILERSGLRVGADFFLAFSPEREDPGNQKYTTRTVPKVVGGVTEACLKVAEAAYGRIVERVVTVSSARVAEAVKLLENIYRCVNVALVNELKVLFQHMDIDVWEVIDTASTKPFGFSPFYPGPGLGGHCIPIDPFYLAWKARQYDFTTRFIELAGEINQAMPSYVVSRTMDALNEQGKTLKGAEILLVGVAYKRNVDDVRESPALAIVKLLESRNARVQYHDPCVPVLRSRHLKTEMRSIALTPEVLRAADAVIIVTDHQNVDYRAILAQARLIIDTRNATAPYRNATHGVVLA